MDGRLIPLADGFSLADAEIRTFARYHALYRADPFLRGEAELNALFCEGAPCKWLYRGDRRVAGLVAGGGVIGQFFAIPPFQGRAEALRAVALHLRAQDSRPLLAHGVTMQELDDYFRLGFRLTASLPQQLLGEEPEYSWQFMRAMLRPVGDAPHFDCAAQLRAPHKADIPRIAKLLAAAYGTSDPARQSDGDFRQDVQDFFSQRDEAMRAASSLASADGELIGACLVVRWEGSPLLFDIAVHPSARQGGIAKAMIARALTALDECGETRLRLFVECGNPAESLYHAMGFVAGPKTTSMALL